MTKLLTNDARFQKYICSVSFLFLCLTAFVISTDAQTESRKWRFAGSSVEGIKQYYRDTPIKIGNLKYRAWAKIVWIDKSYFLSEAIWDCKNKLTKGILSIEYDPNGFLINRFEGGEWKSIVPNSLGEQVALRVCGLIKDNYWAKVITERANLRASKTINSPVKGIALKGDKFRIISYKPHRKWLLVVDDETQVDYWVHNTVVKVLKPRAAASK